MSNIIHIHDYWIRPKDLIPFIEDWARQLNITIDLKLYKVYQLHSAYQWMTENKQTKHIFKESPLSLQEFVNYCVLNNIAHPTRNFY